jgi:metal-responsive CopG/Arc/MetJ family transcriptional regulator
MNYAQVVDICCRDLRRYLETALVNTRGGVVTVKMRRLLRAELSPPDRARYSTCLSNILNPWRWGKAYVIPRRDAEKLLETFDELCASVRPRRGPKPAPPWRRGEMVQTMLYLPTQMLHLLDDYAREMHTSRSEIIRYATYQLLMKYRGAEPAAPERMWPYAERVHTKQLMRVSLHLPPDLLAALDEYAAALQTTRASIVRYAVARMLKTHGRRSRTGAGGAMIVCAPDMSADVAAKFGVQPCQLVTLSLKPPLRRGIDILTDIGLRAAKEGADLWRYADLVAEVRPRWAIAPDAFGHFEKTLELWRRWSPLLSRLTRPLFVFQEFYRVDMRHTSPQTTSPSR